MNRKVYSRRECIIIVQENGFIFDHSTGGHDIYKRVGKPISLPSHKINPMMFRRLMKENNMSVRL